MAIAHLCKHPGCRREVTEDHFLCNSHWAKLPKRIQREVMTRANGWRNRRAATEFLRTYQRAVGILRGGVL